jgi:hypothetical protein
MALLARIKPWLLPAALPMGAWCVLVWVYVAPFGTRTITWEAGESSVLIGRPLPDARTVACEDTRGDCITFIDEPIYMSVIPPAGLWHEMRVIVTYDVQDQEKFELGLMQDFSAQSFTLLPLEPWEDSGGWATGAATFSVENVQKENGAYKLILSLPGVEEVQEKPILHSVKILFTRNTSVVGELKWFIKGLWENRP